MHLHLLAEGVHFDLLVLNVVPEGVEAGEVLGIDCSLGQDRLFVCFLILQQPLKRVFGHPQSSVELLKLQFLEFNLVVSPLADTIERKLKTFHCERRASSRRSDTVFGNGELNSASCLRKSSSCGRTRIAASRRAFDPE